MINQPDVITVYKNQKLAVVIGVGISNDKNISKKEYEKLKEQQIPVITETFGTVVPKLENGFNS